MEPQIAADQGKLFRTAHSEAALDAALPPPEAGKPAEYHAALALPLVRIQVAEVWDWLWPPASYLLSFPLVSTQFPRPFQTPETPNPAGVHRRGFLWS